jgi:hypothetical protein
LNRELAKQLGDKGVIVFEDVKDVIMKGKPKTPLIFTDAVTYYRSYQKRSLIKFVRITSQKVLNAGMYICFTFS